MFLFDESVTDWQAQERCLISISFIPNRYFRFQTILIIDREERNENWKRSEKNSITKFKNYFGVVDKWF